jgi:hypothetical protein
MIEAFDSLRSRLVRSPVAGADMEDAWTAERINEAQQSALDSLTALHPRIEHPRYGCCATPPVCGNYRVSPVPVDWAALKPRIHPDVCGGQEHGLSRPTWPCPTMRWAGVAE